MKKDEAINSIKEALYLSEININDIKFEMETNLLEDGILDSLDAMTFLFNLEKSVDSKITEIDEDFDDFSISSLVSILSKY